MSWTLRGLAVQTSAGFFGAHGGSEVAFENVWLSRDMHLEKVPGFVEFHLLKGPEAEDHTLYASLTHGVEKPRNRGPDQRHSAPRMPEPANKPLYLGHPQFEGFETIQTVASAKSKTP
jgi:hypothetical protein